MVFEDVAYYHSYYVRLPLFFFRTMQFGALGSTVGHAYIHAIDVIGNMNPSYFKNIIKEEC